ncbi:MAG TPA: flagellar protein FlgN [Spongiibacteraceae bacterium]|nr:flagellar protein FlgN [Spongiibacteraceae bacterium]
MNPSSPVVDWTEFGRFLQCDIEFSQQLLDALREERQALEARKYQRFEELLSEKRTLIIQLEQNTLARRTWLQQRGFTDETSALNAAQKTASEVAELWDNAAALWRDCQTANQINEQICRRTQVVVENVLDALRGQHGQKATYNAQGMAQRSNAGRTITSA